MASFTMKVDVRRPTAGYAVSVVEATQIYYVQMISDDGAADYWDLNETSGTSAFSGIGALSTGTYTGGFTLSQSSVIDEGYAVLFNGSTGRVAFGDIYDFSATAAFGVECWVKPTAIHASTTERLVSKEITDGSGTQGWMLTIQPVTGKPQLTRRLNGASDDCVSSVALTAGVWTHVYANYDGTTMTIYVNGVLTGTTASSKAVSAAATVFMLAARSDASSFFNGALDAVAIYSGATRLSAAQALSHYYMGWTNVTADVQMVDGMNIRRGLSGNGPTDVMADTGHAQFSLRNTTASLGGVVGWYSPAHASKWPGWGLGCQVRITFTDSSDHVVFRGKVGAIDPIPGSYGPRRVRVTVYDPMRDLMATDVRELTIQIDQTQYGLIKHVVAVIPTQAYPFGISIGSSGGDTYPYAFFNAGGGVRVAGLLKDIVQSGLGRGYVTGNGVLTFKRRDEIAATTSSFAFTDSHLTPEGLEVPSGDDGVFNRARVTAHPQTIDAAATTVLYALSGSPPEIGAGQSVDIWGDFRSPSDVTRLIGGTATVTPVVATTDYTANTASDGSGSDITASVTVTATPFASTCKFTIANGAGTPAFLTKLQIRGKGIYDDGPQTAQASSEHIYGDRAVDIDLPYQDDVEFARNAATYLVGQYESLANQVQSITFLANKSATLLTQALTREIMDKVTVTETVTGLSAVAAYITSIDYSIQPGLLLTCRFGLAPASPYAVWQLELTGATELDSTALLGL
jgi:hypothetical protein